MFCGKERGKIHISFSSKLTGYQEVLRCLGYQGYSLSIQIHQRQVKGSLCNVILTQEKLMKAFNAYRQRS